MRFRLRTLLILLALGPPLGAWGHRAWREHCERQEAASWREAIRLAKLVICKTGGQISRDKDEIQTASALP
jgi:hypothetical protein